MLSPFVALVTNPVTLGTQASPGALSQLLGSPLFLFGSLIAIAYFLMIRPQRIQQREIQEMLDQLKKNDQVQTSGGFFGKVVSIDKDGGQVVLKVDEQNNVRMRVTRSSIVAVVNDKKDK